MVIPFLLRVLL